MPTPTIQDALRFISGASIAELEQIVETAHTRLKRQREIANAIGIEAFAKDQRVRVSKNVQRMYRNRLGTVVDVKIKRIDVKLDSQYPGDEPRIVGFLPEHITIVDTTLFPTPVTGAIGEPIAAPIGSILTIRDFNKHDRVRISERTTGK